MWTLGHFSFCVLRYTGRECKQKTRKQESEREFLIVPILLKKKTNPNKQTNKQTLWDFTTSVSISIHSATILQCPGLQENPDELLCCKGQHELPTNDIICWVQQGLVIVLGIRKPTPLWLCKCATPIIPVLESVWNPAQGHCRGHVPGDWRAGLFPCASQPL